MRTFLAIVDVRHDEDFSLAVRQLEPNTDLVVCRDGEGATAYLFSTPLATDVRPPETPDLVLVDLTLPNRDILSFLTRLRQEKRTRLIPVAIMTTVNDEALLAHCYDMGANSVVRKPTKPTEYIDLVQDLARYWLQVNLTPSPVG